MIPNKKRVVSPQGFWLNPMSPRRAEGEALAAGLPAVIRLLCRYIYIYVLYIYIICIYSVYIYIYVLFSDWTLREGDGERERERDVCIIFIYLCVIYIFIQCRIYFCVCVCMYCSIICFRLHKYTHSALVAQMDIVYTPFQWHFKSSHTIAKLPRIKIVFFSTLTSEPDNVLNVRIHAMTYVHGYVV